MTAAKRMNLALKRESTRSPDCTLGLLHVGDHQFSTIERPWIPAPVGAGGTKGISCVPRGLYRLVRHNTEAHPETWALVNEDLDVFHHPRPDKPYARSAVLIHPANFAHELRGCVAPGMRTTRDAEGRFMVADSRRAMRLIQTLVPWIDGHTLEIS